MMGSNMKLKTVYICEQCGHESPKWQGKCPDCDAWNSFAEDVVAKTTGRKQAGLQRDATPLLQAEENENRYATSMPEFDRVLGGGIMPGSLILLCGEPGIGKSTLTLKVCEKIASQVSSVLYISGEESPRQISSRAKRLGIKNENIQVLGETNLENILATIQKSKPGLVVIDSIQVVSSGEMGALAGSVSQTRYATEMLMKYAKENHVPVLIIGHVTKDGNLAGPKILEHLVDTVLLIEGDRYQNLRLLRGLKNRYGSTNEVGLFEMTEEGLNEVANASKLFLEGRKEGSFGSAITATVEGTRPLLIEVQALTNISPFGYPKRTASGFDVNRLQLLVAVIQKHLGLNVSNQDVYVNVVGGFRLSDPAGDLAVCMAIISSLTKTPLPEDAVFAGEVGLSGELRSVSQLGKRVNEAEKIGFRTMFVPESREKIAAGKLEIKKIPDLIEAIKALNLSRRAKN